MAANSFGAAGPPRSSPGHWTASDSIERLCRHAKLRGRLVHHRHLYFLLVSGDSFLRRLVEVLPRFASKRQAVDISQQIGRDISAYLLTITLMNALVGAATALVMWSTGVGDPILWGTVGYSDLCANFRARRSRFHFPVRRLAHDHLDLASFAPGDAPGRHPSYRGRDGDADVLARRFTLNPVLVVFFFCFGFGCGRPRWILSAPILATTKIVCDRIRPLAALGHILSG